MFMYASGSLKSQRKGRAAFPSIVPSGDGVRKSARLFRSPVSMAVVFAHIRLSGGCVLASSLTNGGSGIRKDPAATYTAVRDPHPFTWVILKTVSGGFMPNANPNGPIRTNSVPFQQLTQESSQPSIQVSTEPSPTSPKQSQHPSPPPWLKPGIVRPVDYCRGFMHGLGDQFDECELLAVFSPIYEPTAVEAEHARRVCNHSMKAAIYMRGLYDGLKERHRLHADPALLRACKQFMGTIELIAAHAVQVSRGGVNHA